MRAGLALTIVLALGVTPVVAQGKTKAPLPPQGVAALEMCERFAAGDVLAVEAAVETGWDAREDTSESPFVKTFSGGKDLPGIGYATLFALVETYPASTFGYCRVDVMDVAPDTADEIQAIQNLGRYEGQAITNGDGTFASLGGTEDSNRLLLTHATPTEFVLQLTITTPKAAPAAE